MGMLMDLPKEDNLLYHDFKDAYWCIENIRFVTEEGQALTTLDFRCYPTRAAKMMDLRPVQDTLSFGGPTGIAYQPLLHDFRGVYPTEAIFPNGIPIHEKAQKDVLYGFIKEQLHLTGYTDVLED